MQLERKWQEFGDDRWRGDADWSATARISSARPTKRRIVDLFVQVVTVALTKDT